MQRRKSRYWAKSSEELTQNTKREFPDGFNSLPLYFPIFIDKIGWAYGRRGRKRGHGASGFVQTV